MQVKIRLLNQGHSMSDIQKLQYQNQSRNMEHPLKKMHPEEPGKKKGKDDYHYGVPYRMITGCEKSLLKLECSIRYYSGLSTS